MVLVHDYLTQRGGAERVVLSLTHAFPQAPVFTSLFEPDTTFPQFANVDVRALSLNRLALFRSRHRLAFPLFALAFASKRLDADVVICSSSGWAHGIRTTGRKVVYCHSPAKWLYRPDDYLGGRFGLGARLAAGALGPVLRLYDRWAGASADLYLANSTFIADQVERIYGFRPRIVPPPLGLDSSGELREVSAGDPGFFLTVARLMPYKHVAETVEAFRMLPQERLVVVGDGPERRALEVAAPANVRFIGEVDDAELRWLYSHCAGLVCASREDFGLTPIEAAAFGKPTAALRFGGFLDTVTEEETGTFFDDPEPEAIASAVRRLAAGRWDDEAIRLRAGHYSEERFVHEIRQIVAELARSAVRA